MQLFHDISFKRTAEDTPKRVASQKRWSPEKELLSLLSDKPQSADRRQDLLRRISSYVLSAECGQLLPVEVVDREFPLTEKCEGRSPRKGATTSKKKRRKDLPRRETCSPSFCWLQQPTAEGREDLLGRDLTPSI